VTAPERFWSCHRRRLSGRPPPAAVAIWPAGVYCGTARCQKGDLVLTSVRPARSELSQPALKTQNEGIMATATRFPDALAYAERYWRIPCHDDKVFGYGRVVEIAEERRHFKLSDADWRAAFLTYLSGEGYSEGLFFVPRAEYQETKSKITEYSDYRFICSWDDHRPDFLDNDPKHQPRYTGLDDCANFVSHCLAAQHIHVASENVGILIANLRRRHDTKTLARKVIPERAKLIVNSGIVKPGDLIFYGIPDEDRHSSIYLGAGQVATHTWSDHAKLAKSPNDWTIHLRDPRHKLVTVIHFSFDDARNLSSSTMIGWWTVTWMGQIYYYHFDAKGHVGYVRHQPGKSLSVFPHNQVGYWFETFADVKICWTMTGTFEVFPLSTARFADRNLLIGKSNGQDGLRAVRGINNGQ
jgi:hypothetical protein